MKKNAVNRVRIASFPKIEIKGNITHGKECTELVLNAESDGLRSVRFSTVCIKREKNIEYNRILEMCRLLRVV